MGRVDHRFRIGVAPPDARRMVEEELGWELRRRAGFALVRREPLRLLFSDFGSGTWAFSGKPRRLGLYGRLRELTARRLEVELAPDGAGTILRIRGHADQDLCEAIERLGAPGQWPERRMSRGVPAGLGEDPPPDLSRLPLRRRRRR